MSYYGVIEANNRGGLHFHLLCFGSLPPHVLTDFATCPVIRKKIAEVLESYYTTELDREFIVYKALQNVLSERKTCRLPVFTLNKQNTANLIKAERVTPVAGLTDHNSKKKIRERTKMQDSQQQIHDHIRFTCSKGIMGKTAVVGTTGLMPATKKSTWLACPLAGNCRAPMSTTQEMVE